jgi:hypothetical protein
MRVCVGARTYPEIQAALAVRASQKPDDDLAGDDEDIDTGEDEEPSADDEVDLGGDDDLGVEAPTNDDDN